MNRTIKVNRIEIRRTVHDACYGLITDGDIAEMVYMRVMVNLEDYLSNCEITQTLSEGVLAEIERRSDETIESITFKKMVKAVKEEMREVQNFAERRNDGTVCSYGVPANANQHTQRVGSVGERRE